MRSRHPIVSALPLLLISTLAGCSYPSATDAGGPDSSGSATESIADKQVMVFIDDGALQCEPGVPLPQHSAARLIQAGIPVHSSACGQRTGMAYAAMCGAGTSGIHLHTISTEQLSQAQRLGFAPMAELQRESATDSEQSEPGYQIIDCPAAVKKLPKARLPGNS